jgi:zinc transport system permease protein
VTPEAPSLSDFWAAFELFRDPVLSAVVAGAALGFLSVYVVLRRMVFLSAAITQAAALGVALAFYADIHLGIHESPVLGASALSLLAALLLAVEPARLGVTRESLLGVTFAISGGAAVLVGDRIAQEAHDIQSILFGTAVLVRPEDLTAIAWVGGISMAIHVWWYRGLALASFDPVAARVQGLPVGVLNAALFLSIGAMVGVSTRALGALPVFAFSTLPGVAALLAGVRLGVAFGLATLIGALSGGLGYLVSFLEQLPVGGSQTMTAGAFVLAALVARGAIVAVERLRRR